jgi:predicted nuclease of predicted toxin-antitoxin system
MKLLFDQNLSHKLAWAIADLFPDSLHVRAVGLTAADDSLIWNYAKGNGFMIVSKDSDFYQMSLLYGHPPKVVWIRRGNCSTADVEAIIRQRFNDIKIFYEDAYESFLILL